jgi:hypothetical protein
MQPGKGMIGMMDHTADMPTRQRLGAMLIQRRVSLDSRYRNRRIFAGEAGLDYRLIYDIEEARRANFGASTLAAIEGAYRLRHGAIASAMEGGELELPESAGPPAGRTLPTIAAALAEPGIERYLAVVVAERDGGFPSRDETEEKIWDTPMLREDEKTVLVARRRQQADEGAGQSTGLTRGKHYGHVTMSPYAQ